jgi:flagellar hook-associated protein 3 FlgL
MRVTNEQMVTNTMRRLSTRLSQYEQAQSRLATGKQILRPSDDPSGANRGLSLRATLRTREQEARNAEDGLSWLESTDSQLQAAMDRVQRARELTVQGLNPHADLPRNAIADEVATIREELVGIANAGIRGRYLFSGHHNQPAVVEDGGDWHYRDPADPIPAAPEVIERRVGDNDRVRVNLTAAEVFFDADGNSIFGTLRDIEDAMRAGDQAGLSAELANLDGARDRLGGQLAVVGANTNWIESALSRSQDSLFVTQRELNQVEDADYAEAVMDLQVQDIALQSTLQALARALPQSLAAFLR